MDTALVVILFAVSSTACQPTPVVPVHPVDPKVGAGCVEACANAENLQCAEILTPTQGTCVDACKNYESGGGNFCTELLAGATSCEQLERVAMEGCE